MNPRKPTQAEIEDIFTPQEEKYISRKTQVDYTYTIGILRTEYEQLEDRLEYLDKQESMNIQLNPTVTREIIMNKLNEIHGAIELLKGVD